MNVDTSVPAPAPATPHGWATSGMGVSVVSGFVFFFLLCILQPEYLLMNKGNQLPRQVNFVAAGLLAILGGLVVYFTPRLFSV